MDPVELGITIGGVLGAAVASGLVAWARLRSMARRKEATRAIMSRPPPPPPRTSLPTHRTEDDDAGLIETPAPRAKLSSSSLLEEAGHSDVATLRRENQRLRAVIAELQRSHQGELAEFHSRTLDAVGSLASRLELLQGSFDDVAVAIMARGKDDGRVLDALAALASRLEYHMDRRNR